MLLGVALFMIGALSVHGSDAVSENASDVIRITKLSAAEGLGESVGVWIKSDGGIVVTGQNPEDLPSEIQAMGYSVVTKVENAAVGEPAYRETWQEGWVVDLDKMKEGGATIGGFSEGDMLRFFFSTDKTITGLDDSGILRPQTYTELAGNGVNFVDISLREANPYNNGGMSDIRIFRFQVRHTTIGQPLPGSLGLMACGSGMLWLLRRRRSRRS